MRIEFTYARPPEYFRSLLTPTVRRSVRPLVAGAVAAGVVGLGVGIATAGSGLGVSVCAALLVTAVGLGWRARRRFLTAVTTPAEWSGPRRYLLTDLTVESASDSTESRWQWEVVDSVAVMPQAFILQQKGGVIFDVPRAPLQPEEDAQIITWLEQRRLTVRNGRIRERSRYLA